MDFAKITFNEPNERRGKVWSEFSEAASVNFMAGLLHTYN
jgi:hypothetical protein